MTLQIVYYMQHTGEGSSRKVIHYHFTSWPDHGVPEYAGPILNYLRRINAQHKPTKGPILVHCRYFNLVYACKSYDITTYSV